MKNVMKIAALMLVLLFAVGMLAACGDNGGNGNNGGDNGGGNQAASVKGTTEEHGYYKVLVPEGYTLKHEDAFGDNDPKAFTLNQDSGILTYFTFNMFSEDSVKLSVDTTKEMNDGAKDITATYNGVVWTGVTYDYSGTPCFSMYADFGDDHFVLVSGSGNAYDGDVTGAVLSSLVVNVTE